MHVEVLCAGVIVDDLVGICMDATIDFDFDLVLDTKGIEDEWTVWMLPTEFQASQPASSNCLPELLLCLGWVTSGIHGSLNDYRRCSSSCLFGHSNSNSPLLVTKFVTRRGAGGEVYYTLYIKSITHPSTSFTMPRISTLEDMP